jgi:hypothetical protein
MKLVRLIEMCLNETYSIDKHLSESFPIQNGVKQRDAGKSGATETECDTDFWLSLMM